MSNTLFRRAWTVIVDTLDVSALDIEFKIVSSIKSVPNRCVLTLWNMNPDHRAQLLKRNRPNPASKQVVGIPVKIDAGYVGNTSTVFTGDLREVASQREATDWKTTLSGDDGGRAYREGRIGTTFGKGTPISTVIQACAQSMGVGLGNTATASSGAQIPGIGAILPHSLTLSGSAASSLTRVLDSVGLTWSIQQGALQLLQKGKPLDLSALSISSETGLIDSPEASIDATVSLGNPQQFAPGAPVKVARPHKPKDPGILKLKTLLIPGMVPGRKIVLQSSAFNGNYMLVECEYVGQSWSKDWYIQAVARIY